MTNHLDTQDLFSIPPAYPAMEDFNFQISQLMQGYEPAMGNSNNPTTTTSTCAKSMSTNSSEVTAPANTTMNPVVQPTPSQAPAVPAPPAPSNGTGVSNNLPMSDGVARMLDAHALASGPASRRRGLAYAQHIKAVAREEFKEKRRLQLEAAGEGDRTKRRKKNDTSMTERQKYRRRLQKNQDSAAAARYAQERYLANLESQVQAYDDDMLRMENKVRRADAERDELKRVHTLYIQRTQALEAELMRYRQCLSVQNSLQQQQSQPVISAAQRCQQSIPTQAPPKITDEQAIHFDQIVDALYNGAQTQVPNNGLVMAQKNKLMNYMLPESDHEHFPKANHMTVYTEEA